MNTESTENDSCLLDNLMAFTTTILKTGLFLLAASEIVTMLPQDVFHTEAMDEQLIVTLSVLLCVGIASQIFKWIIARQHHHEPTFREAVLNREWCNLVHASRGMALLSAISSATVSVLSLVIGSTSNISCYWAALAAFSSVTWLLINARSIEFHQNCTDRWMKFCLFLSDRYLLFLFPAVYIHTNFFEARETLAVYHRESIRWRNITDFDNSTSNRTDHHDSKIEQVYDYFRSVSFAMTAGLMITMAACQTQRGHQQTYVHRTGCNLLMSGGESPTVKMLTVFFGFVTMVAAVCMILTTASLGLNERPIIIFYVKMSCCVAISVYSITTLLLTKACCCDPRQVFRQIIGVSKREIGSCFDIVLLRYSLYGLILFLCLLLVAGATSGVVDDSTHLVSYLSICSNILAVWLQYAVFFHFSRIYRDLEMHFDSPERRRVHSNLRWFLAPLVCFNVLFWVYDLYQWKGLARLHLLHDGISPGPVWAVLETVSFPFVIFFRFHSAHMCFTIFRRPKYEDPRPAVLYAEDRDRQPLFEPGIINTEYTSTERGLIDRSATTGHSSRHIPVRHTQQLMLNSCVAATCAL